ncbi:MAG: hypothetical protein HY221_02720 [Candidatus Sungbacteria bacterium]|uniref:Uncharacterized protein n=1 Tax=Candidatus Sungiibacteriota bacterium TaxID=2750080 RepID=A0A932VPU0_9BACT|nr:hypothetical protein [Candidatus Sungbacteria bacterium]
MRHTYAKQELDERYKKLPKALKDAMFSPEIAEKIFDIGKRNGLNIEKTGFIAEETGFIILGLTQPREFVGILADRLGTDRDAAYKIASEISHQVLFPLRETLKQTHDIQIGEQELQKEALAPKASSVTPPTAPLPAPISAPQARAPTPPIPIPAPLTPTPPTRTPPPPAPKPPPIPQAIPREIPKPSPSLPQEKPLPRNTIDLRLSIPELPAPEKPSMPSSPASPIPQPMPPKPVAPAPLVVPPKPQPAFTPQPTFAQNPKIPPIDLRNVPKPFVPPAPETPKPQQPPLSPEIKTTEEAMTRPPMPEPPEIKTEPETLKPAPEKKTLNPGFDPYREPIE